MTSPRSALQISWSPLAFPVPSVVSLGLYPVRCASKPYVSQLTCAAADGVAPATVASMPSNEATTATLMAALLLCTYRPTRAPYPRPSTGHHLLSRAPPHLND